MTPFEASRRLTGSNVWFAGCGAVLETTNLHVDDALVQAWRTRIAHARAALGWPAGACVAQMHAGGASFALAAPLDQLLCATDVNEWALQAAIPASVRGTFELMHAPGHPSVWNEDDALRTLDGLSRSEAMPRLVGLCSAAGARNLPALLDDAFATFGSGRGGRSWPIDALPSVDTVPWDTLRAVPTALVTGSNGKTTTVRLIAALGRAHGSCVGSSSTEGLMVGDQTLDAGDFSGPMGARTVLRDTRVDVAILETARGGMLRRGLGIDVADVAVVTNVSEDHFGEYGVFDLARLAQVKLTVARAVQARGLLVLNADDAALHAAGLALRQRIAWFGRDLDAPALLHAHAGGHTVCGVREGRLWLQREGFDADLGAVLDMPLTVDGRARYNIANLAAAALAADGLGIAASTISAVFARFGADNADNRGRLERWSLGGVAVWLDYAHNPEGLAGLFDVALGARGAGRLGVLLGQAGNRLDVDLRALAAETARWRPDQVMLKDIVGYERGREPGEVAGILRGTLIAGGVAAESIGYRHEEAEAVRALLEWAAVGDTLVLPVHGTAARLAVIALLDGMARDGWRPGSVVPASITLAA